MLCLSSLSSQPNPVPTALSAEGCLWYVEWVTPSMNRKAEITAVAQNHAPYKNKTCTVMLARNCTFHWYQYCSVAGGVHSEKLRKFAICSLREWPTQHISNTLQHSRQLWRQISGMQQQRLVASWWYKNFAKRCFREGTENDIRKYMISSRLSNVSDCHVKSHLALAGTVAWAPFLSCQIQHLTNGNWCSCKLHFQWTQPFFQWCNWLSAWLISPCVSVHGCLSTDRLL